MQLQKRSGHIARLRLMVADHLFFGAIPNRKQSRILWPFPKTIILVVHCGTLLGKLPLNKKQRSEYSDGKCFFHRQTNPNSPPLNAVG